MRPLPYEQWKAEREAVAVRARRRQAAIDNRTPHERRCDLAMEWLAGIAVVIVVAIAIIWRPW